MSSESWCCERADCNAKGEQQGKLTQHHDHCSNRSEAFADEAITCQSKLGPTTETVPTLKDNGIDQRCIVADGLDVNMRDDDSRKRTHHEATSPNKRNDDDTTGSYCSLTNGDVDDRKREDLKDDGYMSNVINSSDSRETKKRKVQMDGGTTPERTPSLQIMLATSASNAAASTVHHDFGSVAADIAHPPPALTTSVSTNDNQAVTHGLPLDLLAAPHTSFGSANTSTNATRGYFAAPRPLRETPAFDNVRRPPLNTFIKASNVIDDAESDGNVALDNRQCDNGDYDKEHAGKEKTEHDANAFPVNGTDVEGSIPKRTFWNLFSKVAVVGIMLVMALRYVHSKGALTNTISATGINKCNVANVLYEDESFY